MVGNQAKRASLCWVQRLARINNRVLLVRSGDIAVESSIGLTVTVAVRRGKREEI